MIFFKTCLAQVTFRVNPIKIRTDEKKYNEKIKSCDIPHVTQIFFSKNMAIFKRTKIHLLHITISLEDGNRRENKMVSLTRIFDVRTILVERDAHTHPHTSSTFSL